MQEQTLSNNAVVTRFRLCPPQVDESHVVISVSTSLSVNSAPNRDKKSKTTPLDQPKPSCNDTTLHQTQADSVHQKKETMQIAKNKKKTNRKYANIAYSVEPVDRQTVWRNYLHSV